ncbi:hypothetical protein EAE96_008120 [Botrytis aclada]|nr:hypothetical protein EAE96_008120 [Botrytis aclada]
MNWDSKNLKEGRESTTVNYGGYNAKKGTIVVDDIEASNDAMTGANRLQSCSITYQSWNQVAGPHNVGKLKMAIQKNVKNLGTRQIAKDAYTRKGLDFKKDTGDWAMDPADNTRQQAFLALLGSDNGRPTEYMLTDFHNTLGDKTVMRILTYPYDGVDVEVDDGLGWFHMVLMEEN